jgi:hypothetical protein
MERVTKILSHQTHLRHPNSIEDSSSDEEREDDSDEEVPTEYD